MPQSFVPQPNKIKYVFLMLYTTMYQRVNTDGETKEDLRYKDRIFSASFAFLAITSIIIRLEKHTIRQINRRNLTNLIYFITYSDKMTRNGRKTATYYSASFPPHYRRVLISHLLVFYLWLYIPSMYVLQTQ